MLQDPSTETVIVKLSLLGERRLEFTDQGVTYVTEEIYPIPLPVAFLTATFVTNRPILYQGIHAVSRVIKRQKWALFVGLAFLAIATWSLYEGLKRGTVEEMVFCSGMPLLFGIPPLWAFYRGRPFLLVGSKDEVICLPMDRQKGKIRGIVALLHERCPADTKWDIGRGL